MRLITIIVAALIAVLAPAASPLGDPADPRIAANPLLQQIARNAPDQLPEILAQLDELSRPANEPAAQKAQGAATAAAPAAPPADTLKPLTSPMALNAARMVRAQPTAAELAEIRANPAISAIYKINPDPMLDLLRRMIEAAEVKPPSGK